MGAASPLGMSELGGAEHPFVKPLWARLGCGKLVLHKSGVFSFASFFRDRFSGVVLKKGAADFSGQEICPATMLVLAIAWPDPGGGQA